MTTSELLEAYNPPPSWDRIRLRWLSKRYAGGTPDTKNPDYWEGGAIPWLNSGAVNQGTITQPSDYITALALRESSAKWIPSGSLVMALAGQGKTKATVGFLEIRTTGNQSLAAIIPQKVEGKYLYWWLTSQYLTLRNLSSQDGRDGLNLEMIGSIVCPVPPLSTQQRISNFLDEKTVRIDGLIEKKRALLERLAEKRQALITRAVTKGLDRTATMKPSGIDWLGDIPAHWSVAPLRWYLRTASGEGLRNVDIATDRSDTDFAPVIGGNGGMGFTDAVNSADASLVIGRVGAHCGNVHLIQEPSWITDNALKVYDIRRFDDNYLFFALRTRDLNTLASRNAQPLMTGETVKAQILPIPPLEEQEAIGHEIKQHTTKIDKNLSSVQESTELLREYRAALVTAAVTGQMAELL